MNKKKKAPPIKSVQDQEMAEPAAKAGDATAPDKGGDAPPADKELWDRLVRLQADFDNYRKRMAKERQEVFHRAMESLMEELLPVLDHFELGLETAERQEGNAALVDGFRMIHRQLLTTLERFGLAPFETAGEPFDPHCHEAVNHLPSQEIPENAVLAQTRRGYRLGDRLLRAAQVVVSSGPPQDEEEPGSTDARDTKPAGSDKVEDHADE